MAKMKDVKLELERIQAENNGLLLPEDVVEAARVKESILHDKFTWDDTAAADRYRLWQARQLITAVVTILPNDPKKAEVVQFVSLKSDRNDTGGYRSLPIVLSESVLRAQLLRDALSDLGIFQRKYRQLVELSGIFESIDLVLTNTASK